MFSGLGSLFALLLGAAILLVGNGLQGILLPVRAGLEGFATSAIGLIAAAYSAGFVLGCLTMPHVIKRVGHIRAFAALAAIAASVVLLFELVIEPVAWVPLRVLSGVCLCGLSMIIESWLNERADNADRGRIFALYMMVSLLAVTCGQMLLPLGDPAGPDLFAITAMLLALALVPIALTTLAAPRPIGAVRLRLARLYAMSPVGVVGCFFVGLANGAFGGLGALFAQQIGLSTGGIALFMSAPFIGGALMQLPLGRLSDRTDRRHVIAFACVLAAALGGIMALIGDGRSPAPFLPAVPAFAALEPLAIVGLALLFGGFMYPLYALCVSHTNDYVAKDDFVEASSGLLLTWGIGAAIGPMIAAVLMEVVGLAGLFLHTASVHLILGLFALYRIARRAAVPAEARTEHVYTPGAVRTTPEVSVIDPRASAQADPGRKDQLAA